MKLSNSTFALTLLTSLILFSGCGNSTTKKAEEPILKDIRLPKGFSIDIYAEGVENARSMVMGDKGTLFVGSRGAGKVHAIVDTDNDYKADKVYVIAEGMNMPNGVAFRNGSLYVAEVNKVWRYDNIEDNLANPPQKVLVSDDFPSDTHHGWKYIAFGPDDKLYVPVGAPCNICDEQTKDPRYASITRMNPDGSEHEVYAHGIRNTVGFTWHPQTQELWFTDNGRDRLGDDLPPDELNRAPVKDMNFGYPYCHGGDIRDPDFGDQHDCSEFTPPVQKLGPHVASLGVKFYTGNMFPASYKGQILIAEHGSWNRTTPIGYRVTMVTLNGNNAVSYEPLAEGWLKNGNAWGRPVDILQLKDGSILVSDDFANVIYRITYTGK
ncbi:MAG: sorbosone dehydrogenase family protein [Chitinophagales bacterium]|nr:sorbosone dehydrogenase family protein [Chitinophagaceae bacterium]MCB9064465.1 sorbosone dehydrogenase family protein [Chitinophagales bacterium]